jgi:hypothetical protein
MPAPDFALRLALASLVLLACLLAVVAAPELGALWRRVRGLR